MPTFAAARVAAPHAILSPGWVSLRADRIVAAGPGPAPQGATDLGDVTLAPGFVDMHCHGGGGHSFTDGGEAALRAVALHRRHGTTTVVASLVANSIEVLVGQVGALRPLVTAGELAGVHLEGPWLSPRYAGAHDPAVLADPDNRDIDRVLDAAAGTIRMVTLAPERPGAVTAVRRLVSQGVVVALGHSDAKVAIARDGFEAGASVATHLFNACRPFHHREPGLVLAALEREEVTVEVVGDGVHVHPALLAYLARVAPGRLALVTDAMAAAGASDGRYHLGPMEVTVVDGVARTSSGAIAGSTATQDRTLRVAVAAGVQLADALTAATDTPAQALGLAGIGRIAPGFRADLVVLDGDLLPVRVMRSGRWLDGAHGAPE